jgi:hypothetical protein
VKTILQQIGEFVQKLNSRERTLAGVVLFLLLASVCFMGSRKALAHISDLENMVDSKQQQIVNYTYQMAKRKIVEAQYAEIAGQHSSKWTESEVRDRLRQEIYRLARTMPQELNISGVPETAANSMGDLVKIPKLGKGELHEGGEGFQEYSLNFRIPSADFDDVVAFLERLQGSPQALRIDELDLKRSVTGTQVSTAINITRIIAHGSIEDPQEVEQVLSMENAQPMVIADWVTDGTEASLENLPNSKKALIVQANGEDTTIFKLQDLMAQKTYDMYLDITAEGSCQLAMASVEKGMVLPGVTELTADGLPYRYHLRFTPAGQPGEAVQLRAPLITFIEGDGRIRIDSLLIQERGE